MTTAQLIARGNLTNCVFEDLPLLDQTTRDCLANDPRNMLCLNNRGQLFLRRREFASALELFKQMEELNTKAAITFNTGMIAESIAVAYEGTGDSSRANQYFAIGCKEGMPLSCEKIQGGNGSK